MADLGHWTWGPAWNRLRQDVNILAWLFEEEKWINDNRWSHVLDFNAPFVEAFAEQQHAAESPLDPGPGRESSD